MQHKLHFALQTYWHAGSGLSADTYADTVTIKDSFGLPYLPGKSVRGILRDAFYIAFQAGWLDTHGNDDYLLCLFGDEGVNNQGIIHVTNAQLGGPEHAYLRQEQHGDLKEKLFTTRFSTSIDRVTKTAKAGSLRSMEVCLPIDLYADIHLREPLTEAAFTSVEYTDVCEAFAQNLDIALGFIWAVGKQKYKGLGDVVVTASPVEQGVS